MSYSELVGVAWVTFDHVHVQLDSLQLNYWRS